MAGERPKPFGEYDAVLVEIRLGEVPRPGAACIVYARRQELPRDKPPAVRKWMSQQGPRCSFWQRMCISF